jgi:hypothetical protein
METFLGGLALIAIGALATAAIKYPKGYSRMYWPLLALTALVVAGVFIYYAGYSYGAMSLYPYLDASKSAQAFAASDAGEPPMDWIIGGGCAFMVFLIVFAAMPTILGISEKDDEKGDGKDEGHPPG